jgi:ferredoxin
MKVTVDHDRCSAFGNCVLTAPDLFELDPATNVSNVLKDPIDDIDRPLALEAVAGCPAEAISATD